MILNFFEVNDLETDSRYRLFKCYVESVSRGAIIETPKLLEVFGDVTDLANDERIEHRRNMINNYELLELIRAVEVLNYYNRGELEEVKQRFALGEGVKTMKKRVRNYLEDESYIFDRHSDEGNSGYAVA